MKYDLSNTKELKDFEGQIIHFKALTKIVELKECKNTRTLQQNKALHKFFVLICEQLNELGMEFNYTGVKGKDISLRYTPELVKNFFWRPIQMALFNFESTTKLTTQEMNEVIDVIIKFFSDKGIVIEFPSIDLTK
jgi:hypothetical protein